jgi:hypothetical protein
LFIEAGKRIIAECHPYFWETIHLSIISDVDEATPQILLTLSKIADTTAWRLAGEFFRHLMDRLWPGKDTTYFETVKIFASEMLEKTGMVYESVSCYHILAQILANLVESFQFISDKKADRCQAVTLNYGAQLVLQGDSPDHQALKMYLGSYYSPGYWKSPIQMVSWALKFSSSTIINLNLTQDVEMEDAEEVENVVKPTTSKVSAR